MGAYLGVTYGNAYWIGMLFSPDSPVPDGFEYIDHPVTKYGVFQFEGKQDKELLSEDGIGLVYDEMQKHGLIPDQAIMCIERYSRPQLTNSKLFLECLHGIK